MNSIRTFPSIYGQVIVVIAYPVLGIRFRKLIPPVDIEAFLKWLFIQCTFTPPRASLTLTANSFREKGFWMKAIQTGLL
ncbi:MAG: hypothetical protein ABIK15_07415 [Pseudomonadota bacterium]